VFLVVGKLLSQKQDFGGQSRTRAENGLQEAKAVSEQFRQSGETQPKITPRSETAEEPAASGSGRQKLNSLFYAWTEKRQRLAPELMHFVLGDRFCGGQGSRAANYNFTHEMTLTRGTKSDSDGSNLRNLANPGLGPAWSQDGRWVHYSTWSGPAATNVALKKVPVDGGPPVTARTEQLRNVIGLHGATLYYAVGAWIKIQGERFMVSVEFLSRRHGQDSVDHELGVRFTAGTIR
jgi:hypothetical protein